MTRARVWTNLVALASLAAAGCSGSSSSPSTPATGLVTVSVSSASVVANGVNVVTVHVVANAGQVIYLSTDRGTFAGGVKSGSVTGTGDLILTTCDAATDTSCAGTAHITASWQGGSTGASVSFGSLALCASNCALDPACATRTCTLAGGGSGTCSSGTPSVCTAPACTPNPAGATTETSCTDHIDNDCNGKIDCADSGCDGRPCQAGAPTFICSAGACTDISSGSAITVTPARTRLPANGVATTAVVVKVTKAGAAQAGVGVSLAATLGALSSPTAVTGADGTATVTFTASAFAGAATVTASLTAVPLVSQAAIITMPAMGQLQGSVQYPVMGVNGSGYREINAITVALVDEQGLAYPAGLDVRFEHHQVGGSKLSTPATGDTATCTTASGCVGYLTQTDAGGLSTANLYSGTVAGTLSVVVSASAGGLTRSFTVPNVAVIGARASAGNFSIDCSPRNVPALAETNCSTSLVDERITCSAFLKDRFSNLLGTATQVTFMAEAGAVGQVSVTPAYDPALPASGQPDLGKATQIINTLGAGLPLDVGPAIAGEPSVAGVDGCGRTMHPRNGIATVIAIADGEEAFVDTNGNGVYDGPGSPILAGTIYKDSGEPFIDLGEPFVDQNDNGQYDQGEPFLDVNQNGVYDGPNGHWDANTKIWTETVVVYTGGPSIPGNRWIDGGTSFASACTPTAAPAPFAVSAAQAGPPAVPPTSQTYYVTAADSNLNHLAASTTYGTTLIGLITASYLGLPAYADDYGFSFRYQVCDKNGASCSDRCLATPANLPCIMKPAVDGYGCGFVAPVTITGGATAGNPNWVNWNVSTTYGVYNGSHTALRTLSIGGTNN
jgi:hypothetical protein